MNRLDLDLGLMVVLDSNKMRVGDLGGMKGDPDDMIMHLQLERLRVDRGDRSRLGDLKHLNVLNMVLSKKK